ncbi:histidinol phosphate phosphatase [Clostridium tetani]|uniref:Histidinol-phosphatase n=1 Tax=Clostridium tetani TaxID=1513 RepID=A0ABY0ET10_CLOTA|nr:histidinol phosphate phosphatase [Clostridium tetani]CDI49115.1 histidinol-phosphatase [Clostridium tetani 12124569]KHO39660.1 histidinol phosphatase [Clostridium tetani]RXI38660.1 PHP domain-containing protein [Clostridium tetani]RXI55467.1 PHP domain-containing protein [Clostridium tetani]RXI68538.1 PHP domain-containing protein [Clostridium tetani]
MFDSHIHTNFSTDSKMTLEEVLKKSKKEDIGAILTEHFDLNFIIPDKFIFNIDDYFKQYEPYRNDKLLLGVEMGMRLDCIEENEKIANKYNFDFILGSVHLVEYEGTYYDVYSKSFYQDRNKKETYTNYLEYMLKCVKKYDFIDSLSHIDYICRYARYANRELYYDEYKDILNEIFKELIIKDKALEMSTRRLGHKDVHESLFQIYKNFNKLGGKYVTIGSDAHTYEDIGNHFKVARELAEESGLKPVYYKNRKPEFIKFRL